VGEVQRLLVRAPNRLGDGVMALPALAAVRRAFAGRTIVVAAIPAVAPIFEEETAFALDEEGADISDGKKTARTACLRSARAIVTSTRSLPGCLEVLGG